MSDYSSVAPPQTQQNFSKSSAFAAALQRAKQVKQVRKFSSNSSIFHSVCSNAWTWHCCHEKKRTLLFQPLAVREQCANWILFSSPKWHDIHIVRSFVFNQIAAKIHPSGQTQGTKRSLDDGSGNFCVFYKHCFLVDEHFRHTHTHMYRTMKLLIIFPQCSVRRFRSQHINGDFRTWIKEIQWIRLQFFQLEHEPCCNGRSTSKF